MKTKLVYRYILLAGLMMFAFSVNRTYSQTGTDTQTSTTSTKYLCTMHPDVSADRPGNCEKCGMKLTAQKAEKGVSSSTPSSTRQSGDVQSGTFQSGSSYSADSTKVGNDPKQIGVTDSSAIRSYPMYNDSSSFNRINESDGDM